MKCKGCGKGMVGAKCPGCECKSMGQMMGMKQGMESGMKKGMSKSKASGKKSMPMGFMRGK